MNLERKKETKHKHKHKKKKKKKKKTKKKRAKNHTKTQNSGDFERGVRVEMTGGDVRGPRDAENRSQRMQEN